ncbi:hypothetical protein Rhow_000676 [Rhodococcus wratislaviensis]|uniref:Uncharacterized protein n=1 Tax=Rhodococcus wratislaviensis TaxID=44752 RepID=A0A402C2M3_RHOWR|nr:hypothetical protein [Rhodococcus wratislaviensis]GCE37830.1 hypothetical protein Rhow_000676 [Rhodococcus wratislaviensis]
MPDSAESWRDYLIAQPAGAERAVLLIAVARSLVIKIERNPAWQSPYLADHRRQSDWHKLDELTAHALALRSVYERLGSPPIGSSAAAEVARRDYARKADQLGVVWDQLLDQVNALDLYQRELVYLADDLRDMEQAERIRDLDTDVADLVRSTGASATTDAIEGHAQQSRAHIDALNELFDHLGTVFRSLD